MDDETGRGGFRNAGDLSEQVQRLQSKLEDLSSQIPVYAGYKRKEQRREADKILRMQVARAFEEQLRRLDEIQLQLTEQGRLDSLFVLERGVMRLQLLIDRIKTASYGYSGLFDAVKVDKDALDRLYAFDEAMLDGVERLAGILDDLSEAVDHEEEMTSRANVLIDELRALNETFSRRQDVILQQ